MERTEIINSSDIMNAFHLKGPFGRLAARLSMRILGLDKANTVYARNSSYKDVEFANHALEDLGTGYDVNSSGYGFIPKEGPFITISNHPIGSIDGLMLYSIIGSERPDFKIMANFILTRLPSLADRFIPVNPFDSGVSSQGSMAGLRAALNHLSCGGSLGLFPAGEVSTWQPSGKKTSSRSHAVEDTIWPSSVLKLIRNARVPVIPVYFEAENSKFFHLLGKIHPLLRTARLVREAFNKKGQVIPVRIGRPILPEEFDKYQDIRQLGAYLRSCVYAMESEFSNSNKQLVVPETDLEPIAPPVDGDVICKEMAALKSSGDMLFEVAGFQCYLADYMQAPGSVRELGRLREEAFRAAGEGCGKPLDTDKYDEYYKHLILWDLKENKIVGAYRLGIGKDLFEKHGGVKGCYSATLFKMSDSFANDYLLHSIELGRSFIRLGYQKESLPLMLLFKGLMCSLMRYPEVKYFLGMASISNSYPRFYQSLIVYYLNTFFKSSLPEGVAKPTHAFEPDFLRVNPADLLSMKMGSPEQFDRFLMNLSGGNYRVPTLVKKYVKLNSRVVDFNVDPLFNCSLDALVLLDIADIPESEILALIRDVEDPAERETFLERFRTLN